MGSKQALGTSVSLLMVGPGRDRGKRWGQSPSGVIVLKSSQVSLTEHAGAQRLTPASPSLSLTQALGWGLGGWGGGVHGTVLGGFPLFSVRNWGEPDGSAHRGRCGSL